MASLPILTVVEESKISPPPATVGDRSLPLTFYDFFWLRSPPVHYLFFYNLSITQTQFIKTIIPNLKHSLSITLQHFYPFVGNLIVFPTSTGKNPEIQYVEGDSVIVTFGKSNLDINELTRNQPRKCDKFYHLIPLLGEATKTSDYIKIPLFSVQVTLFPDHGISIGLTNHHTLGDASTRSYFMKAWTSIARSGSDESFLANGTLPFYDRVIKNPKLDEGALKYAKIDTFIEEYETKSLSGPNDKLRGTFVLTRNVINKLKKKVSTQHPDLAYVSSFTVACGYIWSCIAKVRKDELQLFGFPIDCRARMDPPIPSAYFGNCLGGSITIAKTALLMENDGFVTASKLIGENLHKMLTDKNGIVKEIGSMSDLFTEGKPTTMIWVAGTPKVKVYEMDFGWGDPKKVEAVSIDYNETISMNARNDDLEIGLCLSATEMEAFVRYFEEGLKAYIQIQKIIFKVSLLT